MKEKARVKELVKQQHVAEVKLTKARIRQEKLLENRRLENELNRQDKEDTCARIQKINEFKRVKIMEKIQADSARAA